MTDREALAIVRSALLPLVEMLNRQLAVPTDPLPPPPPPPPPEPPPPQVSQRFMDLVAQRNPRLALEDILWKLGRSMTPEELAYARAHDVPNSQVNTPTTPSGNGPIEPQHDLDPVSPRYVTMRESSRTFHVPSMPGGSGHWEFEIAPAVGAALFHRITMQGGRSVENSSGFLTIRSDSDGIYYPPNFRWPFPLTIEAFDASHQPTATNLHVRLRHLP